MTTPNIQRGPGRPHTTRNAGLLAGLAAVALAGALPAAGAENAPRRPFGQWAELPLRRQFIVAPIYQEAEAYHIWRGNEMEKITVKKDGESYGIDYTQGYLALEYGIARKWAADLNVGYTTVGTRSFNAGHSSESTSGLMDTTLGVRYQIVHERESDSAWMPTLTFRAGAVLPGTFDKEFPFAPGNRSAAIEPGLLFRKHFGWQGFGVWGDILYRWMKTTGVDQFIAAAGIFQEIKGWSLHVGYRRLQCLSGVDIGGTGTTITYSPEVKEISDAIDAGFSYTTPKRRFKYAFQIRKVLDGENTSDAFWIGGSVDFPLGGQKPEER
jgi:hypothetical protein